MTSAAASTGTAGHRVDRYGLSALLLELSARSSAAASGTAAAVTAALAAGTVAKVARVSADEGGAAQADALAARLSALAAEDADAHEAAQRALSEPRGLTGATDFLLGSALHAAADVPLRIAEAAADVVVLAEAAAQIAPQSDQPDTTGAAILAAAAARAAAHLVTVNLTARAGDPRALRAHAAADAAERGAKTLQGGAHG